MGLSWIGWHQAWACILADFAFYWRKHSYSMDYTGYMLCVKVLDTCKFNIQTPYIPWKSYLIYPCPHATVIWSPREVARDNMCRNGRIFKIYLNPSEHHSKTFTVALNQNLSNHTVISYYSAQFRFFLSLGNLGR